MENKKVLENIRKVCVVLIIVWMVVVFIFSHQTGEGSSEQSKKIANMLFNNEQIAEKMEVFIRKGAHMAEYAVGAMLFYGYCLTYPNMQPKKRIIFAEMCTVLYAITDEVHQLFIPGRNGSIFDVLIDMARWSNWNWNNLVNRITYFRIRIQG